MSAQACASDEVDVVGTWRPTSAPGLNLPSDYPLQSATLTFEADGDWIGENGCGDSDSGTFEVDGDDFSAGGETIDPGFMCAGVDAIDYLNVLTRTVAEVERPDDQSLELLDEDGDVVMAFEAAEG